MASLPPLHWRPIRRAAFRSIRQGRVTGRSVAWTLAMGGALLASRAVLRGLHRLDDRLHPGWRRTKVRSPLIILTCPRSGSTRLQRLLALDDERFTTFKLYQSVFPSVTLDHVAARGRPILSRHFGALASLIGTLFPEFQHVHSLGLDLPEEDEALFVHSLLSPTLMMLFPCETAEDLFSVDGLCKSERAAVMRIYREALMRHLHAAGVGRTLLIKNVWSASRLETLLEEFPDARVVCIRRDPSHAVTSATSMFSIPWRALFPERRTDGPEYQAFARRMQRYYRRYDELAERLDDSRVHVVDYEQLTRDPLVALSALYAHFNWAIPERIVARLKEDAERPYRSAHRYSPADFGLSRDVILDDLRDIWPDK
ncbi:MAG: sulfotransferase [Myxococcota bacterium]